MPTYYGDPSQADANTPALPVLRIQPNAPVRITMPPPMTSGGGGGGRGSQLDTAALGKKIAGLLNKKYPAGGLSAEDQASIPQGMDLSQLPDDYNFILPDGSNALSTVDAATIPQGISFSQLPDDFNFQV